MYKKYTYTILIVFTLLFIQADAQKAKENCMGQKMTASVFDSLERVYVNRMKEPSEFSHCDLVNMVRILNTITFSGRKKSGSDTVYLRAFDSRILSLCVIGLHASGLRGLAYYSKEYDLYIGGRAHDHSCFHVGK